MGAGVQEIQTIDSNVPQGCDYFLLWPHNLVEMTSIKLLNAC